MREPLILALDCMGGDHAPGSVLEGAFLAAKRLPCVYYLLFGNRDSIQKALVPYPSLRAVSEIIHTPDQILGDEAPAAAIRRRETSLRLAIQAVQEQRASGVVSAGNTGAYMALSKIILKSIPGIERPAIATIFPTKRGASVLLDMGANLTADANQLVQFAIMGRVYAQDVLTIKNPSIGLLNIGSEEIKGHAILQEAYGILKGNDAFNFHGYVEGDDISAGVVDVVVTDGFTGNVVIKTAEGISRLISSSLRESLHHSLQTKLGAWLAKPALQQLKSRMDPGKYNGAMFIGLNGVAIKSHGSANGPAFENAILVAASMIHHAFKDSILNDLKHLNSN